MSLTAEHAEARRWRPTADAPGRDRDGPDVAFLVDEYEAAIAEVCPALVESHRRKRGPGRHRRGDARKRKSLQPSTHSLKPGAVLPREARAGHEPGLEYRHVDPTGHAPLQLMSVVEDRQLGVGVGDTRRLHGRRYLGPGGLGDLERVRPLGRRDHHETPYPVGLVRVDPTSTMRVGLVSESSRPSMSWAWAR
jgi:hypothetical protein